MPPRKAPTAREKPKVVRRVVKKIITEEVIEEVIDDAHSKATTSSKLKPQSSGIKKPTSKKITPKTVMPKKATPAKATAKSATRKNNAAPPSGQRAKQTPTKQSASQAKKETKSSQPRTAASRRKKDVSKPTTTQPKARKTKQTASKAQPKAASQNKQKSQAVKPTITKTRKTPSGAKKPTSSAAAPQVGSHALLYAQMINGAMQTARQAAQEEMNVLIQKTRDNAAYATFGQGNPGVAQPALVAGLSSAEGFGNAGSSNMVSNNSFTARKSATAAQSSARKTESLSFPAVKQTARKTTGGRVSAVKPESSSVPYGATFPPMPRARKVKQTARKSTGIPSSALGNAFSPPMPRAKKVKQTARKTGTPGRPLGSVTASPHARTSTASNDQYVWELAHETGYVPDGFHSYMEPTKRNLGTFTTREAAVQRGRRAIGSEVGYSWEEVLESAELETMSDNATLWKICWSPPDSECSLVTARRLRTSAGRWVVDVEHGYPPSGFHSYQEPTKKQLGPYATRAQAVGIGKKQVGAVYGIDWNEVAKDGELEVVEDSSQRWEVAWTPPDSEHSHVVVRLLSEAQIGEAEATERRESGGEDSENDSDDDDDGFYSVAF